MPIVGQVRASSSRARPHWIWTRFSKCGLIFEFLVWFLFNPKFRFFDEFDSSTMTEEQSEKSLWCDSLWMCFHSKKIFLASELRNSSSEIRNALSEIHRWLTVLQHLLIDIHRLINILPLHRLEDHRREMPFYYRYSDDVVKCRLNTDIRNLQYWSGRSRRRHILAKTNKDVFFDYLSNRLKYNLFVGGNRQSPVRSRGYLSDRLGIANAGAGPMFGQIFWPLHWDLWLNPMLLMKPQVRRLTFFVQILKNCPKSVERAWKWLI